MHESDFTHVELGLELDLHGDVEVSPCKSYDLEGCLGDFYLVDAVRRVKDVCHTLYILAHVLNSIIDRQLHGPSIRLT